MAKILRSIFIKDIGWKLFSVVAAMLLWFVASNIEDPIQQAQVIAEISLVNADILRDSGLTLLSPSAERPGQATITVSGKRSDIGNLDPKMPGLSVYADVRRREASAADTLGEPVPLTVFVELPAEYTLIGVTPKTLSIIIDSLDSRTLEPQVTVTGAPRSGYQAMPYACSPGSMDIEGPASIVGTIRAVSLQSVSIADASQDIRAQKKPIVYDENNQDITSKLKLSADEVTVTVPIYPIKAVRVRAVLNVNPDTGYRIAGEITYSPDAVEIVGRQSELDRLPEIVLGPIKASLATVDVAETFDIREYLAQNEYNLSVREGTPYEVTVTVPIRKESTKMLMIPANRIEVVNLASDSYRANFSGPVSVAVRGMGAELAGINGLSAMYTAQIDLSGLEPGQHSVKVDFKWPDGVVETAPCRVDVFIIDESAGLDGGGEVIE